jgi:predicted nucleic acid-binding protein
MFRVVLDTNVVVSASLAPEGAPATIVELALLDTFTLCVSPEVPGIGDQWNGKPVKVMRRT